MAFELAKVAAKVSAVGGVLYWSVQQGIWGSSKEGSEAGKKLTKGILDPAKQCLDKIPSLTDISSKEYWNSGVSSWLNSVSQLSDMEGVPAKKTKSASSLWDRTTVQDPKSSKEASKTASQQIPNPLNVPNADSLTELKSPSPQKIKVVTTSPQKNKSVVNEKSHVKSDKESAIPIVEEDILAKTVSFKLSKSPTNEYVVEQIVTTRSPRNVYSVEKITKSRLSSPPPTRDRNWPIVPVKPTIDSASAVVVKGFNYVTSVVSPPKSIVRVPTSVRVQSAEKSGGTTNCCNETSSDGQNSLAPSTLQDYETGESLNRSVGLLQQQSCEGGMVCSDHALNEADHYSSMNRTDFSEGCYNTKIAELIRRTYEPSTEATENEPISPTAATLPEINQFSPPKPMLFIPFSLDGPPSPFLLSNTTPAGRLQLLRSPRQQFYTQAFGRRTEQSIQQSPTTALGKAFTFSPPLPTVLMPPRSIFKGISPAEIARRLPRRSNTDIRPTKSVSIQTELSLTEVAMKIAPISPRRSMIANIAPPTPSFILPSPSRQMRFARKNIWKEFDSPSDI